MELIRYLLLVVLWGGGGYYRGGCWSSVNVFGFPARLSWQWFPRPGVVDRRKGAAVEIFDCSGLLCGRIIWLEKARDTAGRLVRDEKNLDPISESAAVRHDRYSEAKAR